VARKLVRGQALDDRDAAVKTVASAIEVAAEAGMLVTVAAEGETVMELAEVAAWRVPQPWMDRLRRVAVPHLGSDKATGQVERLTEREQEVLRLLPSRLTLGEIASELFVSQNTLKFHLRVIYRKLAVNSRAEAVEVAKEMRRTRPD
jgi:LuxR family maltose regulon positive regulatory protein